MQRTEPDRRTWNDVIEDVISEEIARDDAIAVTLDDFEVQVPLAYGETTECATWRFDGEITVTVEGEGRPLVDWLRFWSRRSTSER